MTRHPLQSLLRAVQQLELLPLPHGELGQELDPQRGKETLPVRGEHDGVAAESSLQIVLYFGEEGLGWTLTTNYMCTVSAGYSGRSEKAAVEKAIRLQC